MAFMFYEASEFNGDVSNWDVSSVTYMYNMFYGATKFNGDVSNWDVSSVTTMDGMFFGAPNFDSKMCKWNLDGKVITQMFTGSLCSVASCVTCMSSRKPLTSKRFT